MDADQTMKYHVIYNLDSDAIGKETVYDLLTEKEQESKTNDFWEMWNSVAFEVDLKALHKACKKRNVPITGSVIPIPSGSGFDNFMYKVKNSSKKLKSSKEEKK